MLFLPRPNTSEDGPVLLYTYSGTHPYDMKPVDES